MNTPRKEISAMKDFSVQKYNACSAFDCADWYINLMFRRLRFSMESTAPRHELAQAADNLLRNPIIPSRKLKEGDGYTKNVFRSQVRDVTAFDLLSGNWILKTFSDYAAAPGYRDALAVIEEEVYGEAKFDDKWRHAYEKLDVPAWKMMGDLGLDTSGEVQVKVDLFASEEKLIDDFRDWIRVTRKSLNIPNRQRRFTKKDFDRWHQNRILAYLDITFGAGVKNWSITNQALGVMLFPDEYDVNLAERIRKVVAPMASEASSPAYLEAMFSQALEEEESK